MTKVFTLSQNETNVNVTRKGERKFFFLESRHFLQNLKFGYLTLLIMINDFRLSLDLRCSSRRFDCTIFVFIRRCMRSIRYASPFEHDAPLRRDLHYKWLHRETNENVWSSSHFTTINMIIKFSTSLDALLVLWLVHSISVIKRLFHSRLLVMRLVIASSYSTRAHGIIVK